MEKLRRAPDEFVGDYCISCGPPLKSKRRDVKVLVAILLVVTVAFSSVLYMQYNLLQLRESAIKGLTEERDSLKLKVSDLETLITSLENDKAMLEEAKAQLEQDKANLERELGHYKLKTPTRAELETFLLNDQTDKNEYRQGNKYGIGYVTRHIDYRDCRNMVEPHPSSIHINIL